MTKTDSEIRVEEIRALTTALGSVEAERFITLMLREPFDYTKWQQNLFQKQSLQEMSEVAMKHRLAKEEVR